MHRHLPKAIIMSLFIIRGICLLMPTAESRAQDSPPEVYPLQAGG